NLVIEDVEDLIGWQVRANYIGDKMRLSFVNFAPFIDIKTGQTISFVNLPIDQATSRHRDLFSASDIPLAPADGTNTPQTALFGASYTGANNHPVSPDTPAKSPPDDTSYSAPSGGILASVVVEAVGDESGNP